MMGVREIDGSLEQWHMGVKDLRRRIILAPTPRERERWNAHAAPGAGLDGSGYGGGSGKRPTRLVKGGVKVDHVGGSAG